SARGGGRLRDGRADGGPARLGVARTAPLDGHDVARGSIAGRPVARYVSAQPDGARTARGYPRRTIRVDRHAPSASLAVRDVPGAGEIRASPGAAGPAGFPVGSDAHRVG